MSVKRNRADNKYPIRSDGAKQVPAACVLAWIVPGMGHFYLRKWSHGLLFFLAINTLFFLGCYLGGDLLPRVKDAGAIGYLSLISHFFNGLPFLATWKFFGETARTAAPFAELGKTWIDIACLLNILVIFNAYDRAKVQAFSSKTNKKAGERGKS